MLLVLLLPLEVLDLQWHIACVRVKRGWLILLVWAVLAASRWADFFCSFAFNGRCVLVLRFETFMSTIFGLVPVLEKSES